MMTIRLESPNQADVLALIDALDAYQQPLYPAESHHGIDLAALCRPDVLFAVARADNGTALGCGAIVVAPERGEIKRMYVRPEARGQGIAGALLVFLETAASTAGCKHFALETGYLQHEAIALYRRCGYQLCPPFGDYVPDPNSVFMQKTID